MVQALYRVYCSSDFSNQLGSNGLSFEAARPQDIDEFILIDRLLFQQGLHQRVELVAAAL